MKRYFLSIFVLVCLLAGCSNSDEAASKSIVYHALEEIPSDFALEDAIDSNMLVLSEFKIVSGSDLWDEFLAETTKGNPASIFIAHNYESDEDDSAWLWVTLLEYDEDGYHQSYYEHSNLISDTYPYMIERSGRMQGAAMGSHGFYLVNDESLTYHDLQWSLISSNTKDFINYRTVYQEMSSDIE